MDVPGGEEFTLEELKKKVLNLPLSLNVSILL